MAAQWWRDDTSYETEMLRLYVENQRHLLAALAEPEPIVVWVGNNAHDKLMLAMVARVASPATPLSVVDITGQVAFQYMGQFAVGMCPPDALLPLSPAAFSGTGRARLASQWDNWKTHGEGWRETAVDGGVVEYPSDHLDTRLLARLAESGPQPVLRLVGDVMGRYPGMVPDTFLFWRLDTLRSNGQVVFIPGTRDGRKSINVELAG